MTPARPRHELEALLSAKEVVVFCGSGGVGKTSVAAATALGAAARLGGKVLVLTVDPARRLATALGLSELGNIERRVPPEELARFGLDMEGELWAAMLDTKQSWDELVLRHAPDETTAYQILENRMYHNVTARFVQSHDYIAMERLFEIHSRGDYDLVIVDTPPTRNAIDFLEAPARMAEFFGGRLLHWLTLPYRAGGRRTTRVLNMASKPFYQVADRLLGSRFLQDIAEFFLNFQAMYEGFVDRAHQVEKLMHDYRTTFAVVTTLEAAPLREAELFCDELARRDFSLGALVFNRTLPTYLLDADARRSCEYLATNAEALAYRLAEMDAGTDLESDPTRIARVLRTASSSYRDYSVVATREAELRAGVSTRPDALVSVPSLEADITDLAGLTVIGEYLFEGAAP